MPTGKNNMTGNKPGGRGSKAAAQQKPQGISDTSRWIYGFTLLFIGLFIAASVISFFLYWRDDQSMVNWSGIFDSEADKALNWGGRLGAWLSNILVAEGFGVFALCIPVVLIILSLRIMRFRPPRLRKSVRMTLMLMILGSLSLGYVFGELWNVFGSGLGGAIGIYVARWFNSLIGVVGTGLLLLLSIVLYAVYVNRNTISFVNKVGKGIVDNGMKMGEAALSKISGDRSEEEYTEEYEEEAQKENIVFRKEPDYVFGPSSADRFYDNDDGFIVVDKSKKSETQAESETDGEEFISSSSNMIKEKDEFGFTVQYAAGDDDNSNRERPTTDSTEFVASVPRELGVEPTDGLMVNLLPEDRILDDNEIDNAPYDPRLDLSSYIIPYIDLLEDHSVEVSVTGEEIVENKNRITETLENFGIKINKIKATIGPTVTLYEIVPAPGIRISKIKNLEDDIALSLSALGIRIIAPIPGKGTIGIEVPNKDKKIVSMYSVIKSAKFQESNFDLPIVLGKTIQDETFVIDLAKMPHLLVAGATGQGKSVGLNAVITSLLYKKHPAELKFVLVDPKKVELTLYTKLEKHFLAKLPGEDEAIITDTHKVIYTLNSLCIEMDNRYNLLRKAEVRHVKEYNAKFIGRKLNPQKGHRFMPYIIVIIDEFADLIMTAGREVETPLARLAQLARAIGIHLVIATQRPTTNIITGVIKANFPARIAFRVTSMIDSRTILDQPGANQLIGRGDMLVSTGSDVIRVQCAFIDTPEIERITEFIGNQRGYTTAFDLPEYEPEGAADNGGRGGDLSQLDDIFEEVSRFVVQNQQGSTSSIQRRFSIGYNRAGRIMDQLEMAGIVGRAEGSKPREVLITDIMSLEMVLNSVL